MSSFLRIKSLCKSFPSGDETLEILIGLDLEVEQGQMLAVTGASGSGKSTFLHLAGGMERPDSGTIRLGEAEVTALEGRALARFRNQRIGFVFQFHHLLPEFTALENVMFPLLIRRVTFGEASRRARRLLEEIGLKGRTSHRPGELSGGEQQRVAVARALVGEPDLLLADEPTGNLDQNTSASVSQLLLDVHHRHRLTSIIVTHDPHLAQLCQTEQRLQKGRLVPAVRGDGG